MKSVKIKITEIWQKEVLANLIGEEDLFNIANEPDHMPGDWKEYEIIVEIKRGKAKK